MAQITVHKIVNAPIADVWASWDDYANIADFHPGLSSSQLLADSQETGPGALRQCNFTDGKTYLKEKITEYETERRMELEIIGTNAPITNARAIFNFDFVTRDKTHMAMTMIFTPKMGLLGKLILPLMKMQFSKGLTALLDSNADYVEQKIKLKSAA